MDTMTSLISALMLLDGKRKSHSAFCLNIPQGSVCPCNNCLEGDGTNCSVSVKVRTLNKNNLKLSLCLYLLANHVDSIFIWQAKFYQCQCNHHWGTTTSQ